MSAWAGLVLLTAAAQTAPATRPIAEAVSVEGADACFTADAVRAQVARWLGRADVPVRLGVSLTVDAAARSLAFEVTRDGQAVASRRFEAPPADCADARAAVGLAIALAFDATILGDLGVPVAETPIAPPPPAPVLPPLTVESQRAAPAPVPPTRPAPAGVRRLTLWMEAGIAVAVLPTPAPIASAGAETTIGPLHARVGFLATGAAESPLGDGRSRSRLLALRAHACFPLAIAPDLAFAACGGAAVGRLGAEGRNFDMDGETGVAWSALLARLGLDWSIRRGWALEAAGEVLVPVVRPRLDVEDGAGRRLVSEGLPTTGFALVLGARVDLP